MQTNENKERKMAEKYKSLTEKALKGIKIKIKEGTHLYIVVKDFLEMVENYYKDGCFFLEKKDYLRAIASFSYAHAWIDAGVRLGIFEGKGNKLYAWDN